MRRWNYDNTFTLSAISPTLITLNFTGCHVSEIHFFNGSTPHIEYEGVGEVSL